jgi:hypothetical protein
MPWCSDKTIYDHFGGRTAALQRKEGKTMHIEELATQVVPLSRELIAAAQKRFDNLIKPVGSLAQLEEMTSRYAAILGSSDKQLVVVPSVRLLFLWGTEQHKDQIESILLGKAPVLALAKQVRARVLPQFLTSENTYDYLEEGAMLTSEYVNEEKAGIVCQGCFCPSPAPEQWRPLLPEEDGLRFLDALGQPEIAAMTGSILQAAGMRIPVLLDGVATCLAAAAASKFNAAVLEYCYAGTETDEPGAAELLAWLGLKAPLKLHLQDSRGNGALACLDIFDAGIKAYREMETFEEAGVHVEEEEFSFKVQEEKKRNREAQNHG